MEAADAPLENPASPCELDEYLQDTSRWKTFDDVEDEVHYLRHRGDVLAKGLKASREEIAQLHDAGHRLQQAYEELHRQYREVAADAVYWQSLAEGSRVPESPAMPKTSTSPVPPPQAPPDSPSDAREALRRAAVEAAKVLQQKQGKVLVVEGKENMSAWMSPHKTKGRDADARTPNRRTCVEESPSPCPSARSMPGALLSHTSRSKLKWGIGSSPRRCPKLGTPTRRTSQGEGHFSRSPSKVVKTAISQSPVRRLGGLGPPEALWVAARMPKLPGRSEGFGSPGLR